MRRTGPSRQTVRLVRERDDDCCVRCGRPGPLTTQHRVARGMGGTRRPWINSPENLITLCGSGTTGCHGQVEASPHEAVIYGWRVPSWAGDPGSVSVRYWTGDWFMLRPDGSRRAVLEPLVVPVLVGG